MKSGFLGNFIFLILVNVLIKPIYVFGIDMKVQSTVDTGEYGLYFILFNFAFLFFIVLDLGLTQYNSRTIARNPGILNKMLPNFIFAKFILGLVFLLIICGGGLILDYDYSELKYLLFIGIIHALNSLTEYLRSNIAALHLFRTDAVLSIVNRVLLILICGVLLYGSFAPDFKIDHFIFIQIGTLSVTVLISFFTLLRHTEPFRFSFDSGLTKKIIKEGYPYALLVLLTTAYTRIDAVMLKELLPEKGEIEADYYAAAYRFLDMASMFGLLMASQLLPIFAKLIKEKNKEQIQSIAITGFKIIMFVSVAIAVCLASFSKEIIAAIFDDYPMNYVGMIFSYLIFSLIPVSSSYVFNTLMNANANLRILNVIGVIGLVLNIILNLFLIPEYGALGAVYATLATQSIAAVAHVYYSNKMLNLRLPILLFVKICLFGLLMWGIIQFGICHLSVNWVIRLILGGLAAIPLAGLLGLLTPNMVKEIFLQKR